ncbi:tyrosine-protein phosphatase [Parabacteroides sp. PF5-6]|uniref:tyrosine-protein phosphatase n=1 Tax=Parabacteroides sp. PF5-6 TaxID=1742403 RepID=UPI0024050555|nr:tyrosine-protein phosphatase [Parabacteroides sp. PF5-6]MDF9830585.1 protein tyrosine/serine phosphatase [Parabacteroides sp. PF5-6]
MFRNILSFIISTVTLTGCSLHAPDIYTLCMRDGIGNYIIKWETNPPVDGTVNIYVSDNPEKFNKTAPVLQAPIHQGATTFITTDNVTRKYFKLVFNEKYSQVVGARSVPLDSVPNLRDLGGYFNNRHKMIRWGRVYRSGDISNLSILDSLRLNKLGLKTVIDLRSKKEMTESPLVLPDINIIKAPLTIGDLTDLQPYLQAGRIRKGDAVVYMQDTYLKFMTENNAAFAEALRLFLDKDNYPILFNCSLGKDASGFLSALLLAALSVPEETIMQDYLASNDYMIVNRYASFARDLSQDSQEAITAILSANESYINPLLLRIRKDHGGMNNYLETVLEFTDKDQDKLKDILLY